MNIDSQGDRRELRDGRVTAARHVSVPTDFQAVVFTAVGCARPGWLIRASADPGGLRQVWVELAIPEGRPRPPAPAWVRDWILTFARR